MEKVPSDLQKIFASAPQAQAQWMDLTPIGRRDFITWIESAKQPETRKRRINSVPSRLASGKSRPCCFAIVPMSLYTALDGLPKAKTMWKDLTPDEKRNFTDWINKEEDKELRMKRIEKTCAILLRGIRHP